MCYTKYILYFNVFNVLFYYITGGLHGFRYHDVGVALRYLPGNVSIFLMDNQLGLFEVRMSKFFIGAAGINHDTHFRLVNVGKALS